jgi:DHA3 family multidrug efflux protein-like MFS transporter
MSDRSMTSDSGGRPSDMRTETPTEPVAAGPTPSSADDRTFHRLLVNTLVTGVTSSFVWFALTFWAYIETKSVVVTGVIGAAFSLSSAFIGPAFGTYVDRHRKDLAMKFATGVSALCFALATGLFVAIPADDILRFRSIWLWLLIALTLGGSVMGSMRSIAMSTCVTLLVPEDRRDKANGLVGTVTGVSFAITSVFSGLVVGRLGMGWALYGTLALTIGAFLHLQTITIDEPEPTPAEGDSDKRIDVRGAITAIKEAPGLGMLIAFAAFNNVLGGVFMALMDAYGLELVSVETWGFLWGVLSLGFIVGGVIVARRGLGPVPVRVILMCNLVNWTICCLFTLRSSIVLLAIGMIVWITLMPIIEASEQTVLQRAIPYERQGRVFGFAQLVENAAAPLTSIAIAPLTETFFMPSMTDGWGADAIGSWFGTGPERGIALVFTVAGLIGVVASILLWLSRSYRQLVANERETAPAAA